MPSFWVTPGLCHKHYVYSASASVTGEEQTVSSPGCQLWKSQRTERTLSVFSAHSLLYKHTQSLCANGKTSALGVRGHVCGETGGYLEQRQTLGVRTGPGWTLQLCVYRRVKVWLVSNSMTLLTSAGRCRNYTIWTQKASFSAGGQSNVVYSD